MHLTLTLQAGEYQANLQKWRQARPGQLQTDLSHFDRMQGDGEYHPRVHDAPPA